MGDVVADIFNFEGTCIPDQAFDILSEFYREGKLCDVIIRVDDRTIRCHRIILASCSNYFRGMFMNEMLESMQESVAIQGLAAEAVAQLINFIYTRKIAISVDNIESLLTAAAMLQIDSVVDACCKFMERHLHPSNCLEMRAFAELHGCEDFLKAADIYTQINFLSLMNTEALLKISFRHFLRIISGKHLYVKQEEQVVEAILSWVKYETDSRAKFLPELLRHTRLPLLSTAAIVQRLEEEDVVSTNLQCRDLIDEAKNFKLCPSLIRSPRTQPRRCCAGALFSIGGRGKSGEPFRCVECYDWFHDTWFRVAKMSTPRRHVAVACLNGKVYAIGGHDGLHHLNSVECFDPENDRWKNVVPMKTCRRGMSAGVLGGVIYVAGGLDETTCFNTVERYDPEGDEWSTTASMSVSRGGVGIAGFGGFLYAVGGNDGITSLQSVERYSPHTNKWMSVAPMNRRRAGVGVAVEGEYLYAIGGFDDSSPLDSVERYDPKANQWTYVASLSICRGGVGAGSMGTRIWAVGGHNGSHYLNSVESYDPVTDSWELSAPMEIFRAGSGVVGCDCDVEALRSLHGSPLACQRPENLVL